MISADIDLKELERDLLKMAADFGEANETGIARWGVAVARRLIGSTQPVADAKDNPSGKTSRQKQEGAMKTDYHRVCIVLNDPQFTRRIMRKQLTGIKLKGIDWKFSPQQNITTPQGLNDWLELNRSGPRARPPKAGLPNGRMCVTTERVMKAALRIRKIRAGKAKGGWIGAGIGIARFQRMGSRITIGKNVANYAHKHSRGGLGTVNRSTWTPEGTLKNMFGHVSNEQVLKKSDIDKAIIDAGRNTITWYEKAMQGRLNKRRK